MSVFVINLPAGLMTATDAEAWQPIFAVDVGARLTALLKAAQAAIEQLNSWVGRAFCEQLLEVQTGRWAGWASIRYGVMRPVRE